MFDRMDQEIAIELINTSLDHPEQKDYHFLIAVDDAGRLDGYACYGPTPLTEGTFDLYWIAVDPTCSNRGIGSLLLQAVEKSILAKQGRLLLVETSSQPKYTRTRHFYKKNGYSMEATIRDFYRPGEDKVIYAKRF